MTTEAALDAPDAVRNTAPVPRPSATLACALARTLTTALSLLALAPSCTTRAPAAETRSAPIAPRVYTAQGTVSYEARALEARGYSQARQTFPARFVEVLGRGADGQVVARGATDEAGAFTLTAAAPLARVDVRAVIQHRRACEGRDACVPTMQLLVAPDDMGRRPYVLSTPIAPGETRANALHIRATLDEPEALGGAFHVLDTLARGAQAVYRWSGRELPLLFVTWGHASGAPWSFHHGERPRGSGRHALELMGGERASLETSDADEHDVFIVLHEYGHFVFDVLSSDSNIGGMHPATVLTDPGVAWEEGRATWFACAVLEDARYRDAVGLEPHGRLRQDDDLEQLPANALRGLGSQRTVEEILWDLSDGSLADGAALLPDRDHDGVALGPARVFEAMLALRDEGDTLVSIASFLRTLVARGWLAERDARQITVSPTPQRFSLPRAGEADPWPLRLAPDQTARGKIDGRSDPAPSGGAANPNNGYDAVRTYVFRVSEPRTLEAHLSIEGSGTARDHTELRLELRDRRAELVATAETPPQNAATRALQRTLSPGLYALYVRDAGGGNTANYALRYQLR